MCLQFQKGESEVNLDQLNAAGISTCRFNRPRLKKCLGLYLLKSEAEQKRCQGGIYVLLSSCTDRTSWSVVPHL